LVSAQEWIRFKRVNDMFEFSLVVANRFCPHQVGRYSTELYSVALFFFLSRVESGGFPASFQVIV